MRRIVKRLARLVLGAEIGMLDGDLRMTRFLLGNWKLAALSWERYAREYVRADAPSFDEWFNAEEAAGRIERPKVSR